ncbi:acylneuraminate cytidylyltransferase [Magnetococcus marinus MC-1]|uniref:Acylneuraminate cytidylyltransferase n=1 Tax=Magnetococcus marinus (strain ATCC BAA-1437 / JCM 17883 / MC-1) TaxID=156889 RepID=A0LAC1_MAGMM|nr:pseudaminic acid cytidylyltransferase [Magnetococcus marinus]ABK44914.1 acylneuraminate cytidylyltransferase [Magnetococcus marinus MC-1]
MTHGIDHPAPLCIIPARGGSKRIPRKNIRPFMGKPLIAYSIEAALATGLFAQVVVSTDDAEIAQVAQHYGAAVPFMRPAPLADDFTTTADVLLHALHSLGGAQQHPALCCIYPTAPLLQPQDLREAWQLFLQKQAHTVMSVTTFAFPIQRALRVEPHSGQLQMIQPQHRTTRSNDLEEAYHDAGQFYWLNSAALVASGQIYGATCYPQRLPRYRVQDLDTLEDWTQAELLYQLLEQRQRQPSP